MPSVPAVCAIDGFAAPMAAGAGGAACLNNGFRNNLTVNSANNEQMRSMPTTERNASRGGGDKLRWARSDKFDWRKV
jgi:hypothetical protein